MLTALPGIAWNFGIRGFTSKHRVASGEMLFGLDVYHHDDCITLFLFGCLSAIFAGLDQTRLSEIDWQAEGENTRAQYLLRKAPFLVPFTDRVRIYTVRMIPLFP